MRLKNDPKETGLDEGSARYFNYSNPLLWLRCDRAGTK
jgi:hypothetical protein